MDIVLHCGDLTQIGGLSNYRKALQQIQAVKLAAGAELALVIAGNHDVSLDAKWWAENLIEDEDDPDEPIQARALFDQAKGSGVHMLDEGTHKFSLKDGRSFTIFASPYTPEFGGYAFAYGQDDDHFNTGSSTISKADIVMTHGPPRPSADDSGYTLDLGHDGQHCGCPKLYQAISRTKPALHCFGHIHEGYGAQMLGAEGGFKEVVKADVLKAAGDDTTLLVNAAIQTPEGTPNNGMWVVDVMLDD